MLEKIQKTITKYNMLQKGEKVCVGLSGGADSTCLLLALKKLGYDVFAVHVNHHLRGDESDRDMAFCQNLCNKLNVPLEIFHIDVKKNSEEKGLSIETTARNLRYEIFAKCGTNAKIATAHNLNDCLETTIFNLARGTGLKGICGIPPVRENIIRPLIETSREEIESYLLAENQDFVTDSTNMQTDYSRNKIRHLIIPQLKEINGNLLETYKNTRGNLYEDMDFLEQKSNKLFNKSKTNTENTYDLREALNQHSAIKNRVFSHILRENNVEISHEKITELENLCKYAGKINIKKDTFFIFEDGKLTVEESHESLPQIGFHINEPRKYKFHNRYFSYSIYEYNKVNRKFTKNVLDYGKIKGDIFVRNRRDGDKIQLCGRNFTSSVKKLFNAYVPLHLRDLRVILADDSGLIFVEGFGCADRVKIDENTQFILEIHLDDN